LKFLKICDIIYLENKGKENLKMKEEIWEFVCKYDYLIGLCLGIIIGLLFCIFL
jgi:hypothetical protein